MSNKTTFLRIKTLVVCTAILILASCNLPTDTIVEERDISVCSNEKITEFDFIKNKQEGLSVLNPTNENIEYPKASKEGPWKPVNGKKLTCCGIYSSFLLWDGNGDEYDWNLNIKPNKDFEFIIESVRPLVSNNRTSDEWRRINTTGCFQAEITPDETLYENGWFPNLHHKEEISIIPNRNICVYGAWVMDGGHDWRPEIHPSETIWWRKQNLEKKSDTLYIFGIQDDSNRFDDTGDYTFNNDFGVGWKPWALPPITSQYLIPFEFNGEYRNHMVVNIEELKSRNIVTPTIKDFGDSDDGSKHILRIKKDLQGTIPYNELAVEVNENIPLPINLGVKFVDICRKPNGEIIGYVQISTAFGKGFNGDEGYQVLKVTINYPSKNIHPNNVHE